MSFAGNEQGISSLSATQIKNSSTFIIIILKKLNYFRKRLAANIATILVFFLFLIVAISILLGAKLEQMEFQTFRKIS